MGKAISYFAIAIGAAIFAVFVWPLHGWLARERLRRDGVVPINEEGWQAMGCPGTDLDENE